MCYCCIPPLASSTACLMYRETGGLWGFGWGVGSWACSRLIGVTKGSARQEHRLSKHQVGVWARGLKMQWPSSKRAKRRDPRDVIWEGSQDQKPGVRELVLSSRGNTRSGTGKDKLSQEPRESETTVNVKLARTDWSCVKAFPQLETASVLKRDEWHF